jgi:lipopolysaccharide export system ATP-binding protein
MILRAEHLLKIYKGRSVVNDISVQVSQGEIVGLLGPNGAGKTTSFYMIVGLIQPNSGKIFLEDQDITGLPMYKRAKLGIGYLAQEAYVFRKLSVEENILAVLDMTTLQFRQGIIS